MNYFLPAALRDALLEYMEARELLKRYPGLKFPREAAKFAAQLRDLKPLREVQSV